MSGLDRSQNRNILTKSADWKTVSAAEVEHNIEENAPLITIQSSGLDISPIAFMKAESNSAIGDASPLLMQFQEDGH